MLSSASLAALPFHPLLLPDSSLLRALLGWLLQVLLGLKLLGDSLFVGSLRVLTGECRAIWLWTTRLGILLGTLLVLDSLLGTSFFFLSGDGERAHGAICPLCGLTGVSSLSLFLRSWKAHFVSALSAWPRYARQRMRLGCSTTTTRQGNICRGMQEGWCPLLDGSVWILYYLLTHGLSTAFAVVYDHILFLWLQIIMIGHQATSTINSAWRLLQVATLIFLRCLCGYV